MMNERVTILAKEFINSIALGKEECSNGMHWEMSITDYDVPNSLELVLALYQGDNNIAQIEYTISNVHHRFLDHVVFSYNDEEHYWAIDENNEEAFEPLASLIDNVEAGLFESICAYMHRCAMFLYNKGEEDMDDIKPLIFDTPYYTPHRLSSFMKKYEISKYVPIYVEVVGKDGNVEDICPISQVFFNDECNELLISIKKQ